MSLKSDVKPTVSEICMLISSVIAAAVKGVLVKQIQCENKTS